MANKMWKLQHIHTGSTVIVEGKSLDEAIRAERLDPALYKEIPLSSAQEDLSGGEDTEAPELEDN